jgi:hypothetical protein
VFSTLAYTGLCVWLVPNFPWIFFHLLYHCPYGGHRRAVRQPAHGARG